MPYSRVFLIRGCVIAEFDCILSIYELLDSFTIFFLEHVSNSPEKMTNERDRL